MKQRNQTEKILPESTEENAIISSGWMSLQLFVEMYSLGLELFMQVAGIKNCITKYSKKMQKIILKLVTHQMPQLDELDEAFVDYFQGKFMHNMPQNFKIEPLEALDEDFVDFFREKLMHDIPQNFTIEPLNTQKIIDQNDTCKAWINWFQKVGLVHSEN
uniref:Uncharacterized protein n=1 Tax=Globodera rostochiensis TaxID=31243 RepID=A0A914HLX2_GLORO